jgi:CNP1-like family
MKSMPSPRSLPLPSRRAAAALAGLLLLALGNAGAQSRFEEDFDDQDKPWQEIAVQLPPAPQAANLVPLTVAATATQKFAVDTSSISVGEDGVVRYVLVASVDGGPSNVSYEGIRCATYERKLYAFGQPDGSWSRSRRDQWERIRSVGPNQQHAALAKDYVCENLTIAGKATEIAERLRYQRPFSGTNYR